MFASRTQPLRCGLGGTHVTVRSPVRRPSLCTCLRWPGRAWLCPALGCFRHPEHCAEGHHLLGVQGADSIPERVRSGLFTQVRGMGILGSWTSTLRSSPKFARDVRLSDFFTTPLGVAAHYALTTLP